ncbi:hypothetical protein [Oceanimonas sp. CAM02]|uniref:hypothetical protein n=1 Tax=Oceanimonas sp. CAM02 TaxID=3080336 RepID=UPI002936BF82|nr:hypothetical protein [Oceanimonas sp. CAM02]MDV2857682.1 hypothetical protein [Oceanimonas sp. CAM02]
MNLFLINSPFQLICALEAKMEYGLENNILAITKQATEKSQKQLNSLVNNEDWDKIVNLPGRSKVFSVPLFISRVRKMNNGKPLNNIIYPDYLCWRANLILKNIKHQKSIMIDDGAMTITHYLDYLKDKKSFSRPKGVKDVIIRLMSLKPVKNMDFRENFELYSTFSFPKESFIEKRNKLKILKRSIKTKGIVNESSPAAFIGQGYIGSIAKIEDYIKKIDYFHKKVNRKIIYFPHRSESLEVKEAISNLDYITYHDSEWPIELELSEKAISLSCIGGIMSTALYTLSVIYSDIDIYNITTAPDYYFDESVHKESLYVEEYYKSNNIISI